VENSGRLAAPGGGTDQKVAIGLEGVHDLVADGFLSGAHFVVGKWDEVSSSPKFGEPIESSLLAGNQSVNLLSKPRSDFVRGPGDILFLLFGGNHVDQDETNGGRWLVLGEHVGVEGGLTAEAVETFFHVEVMEIDGEVEGLDFIHSNRALSVEDHSVGSTDELDGPAVDLDFELDGNL